MAQRILLVEDEESLMTAIAMNLEMEGHQVVRAMDGVAGLEAFHKGRIDLVILDVMLPKMDGYSVCRAIRLENNRVPILFLTAKNSGDDRVLGLKIGADDYLTKPFNLEELLLRVEILLRRSTDNNRKDSLEAYTFGSNQVDFLTYEVVGVGGKRKRLSKREVLLLKLMIERKGEVVSREDILETVWGYDIYPSTRTIDNYILAFRKYFEDQPRSPKYFHSVRGVGYKFTDD